MNANERAIIDEAQHVVDGGRDDSLRQVLYALYVTALLLLTYGMTLSHAFFLTQDPEWLRGQVLSWRGGAVLATLAAVGAVATWRAGQVRGPVVAPLPWIDLVVTGPVDRAITLRRWWLRAATLTVTVSTMVGLVGGGGAWIAGVGNPLWLVVGTALALGLGLLLLVIWLAGQVRDSAPGAVPPLLSPRRSLRLLRLESLRAQSARGARMGGAVLLGDLRALRLETASPITRARSTRLRPGRGWTILARRDALGARRQPGSVVLAAVVTILGAAGLAWALLFPAVPVIVGFAAGLLLHLGFSTAAEGLRLQGDNTGTPPLLGFSARTEALGHLVLPVVVCGATATLTAAVVGWVGGASGAYVLGLVAFTALAVLVVAGTTTASAFRGGAPIQAFLPESGPVAMLIWLARQAIVATIVIGGLGAWATRAELTTALMAAALAAATTLWWGLQRVAAVTLEHRD